MAELSSEPKVVQTLYGWYRDGRLVVNRRYQRKLVWTLEEKQKLVDSILSEFPVPAIILAEREGETERYEIIDGLQRLNALMSFVETGFTLEDKRVFDLEQFPTALSYAQAEVFADQSGDLKLSSKETSRFLDYAMPTSIVRNASESQIDEIFDRINSFGHRLSNHERRQAGVQGPFSDLVREISCSIRGDVSKQELPLFEMPSISIELPSTTHGYEVNASEIFWVKHGVLLAKDLRDSVDEECVADLIASMVLPDVRDRNRTALDRLYNDPDTAETVNAAIAVRGDSRLREEFQFILEQLEILSDPSDFRPFKRRLFQKVQGNAYPTIFASVFVAMYELLVVDKRRVSDWKGARNAIENIGDKLDAGTAGAVANKRRKNIDQVKGVLMPHTVADEAHSAKYSSPGVFDIDDIIHRSLIETANYELKQGLLPLEINAEHELNLSKKLLSTIVAIANNGPTSNGVVLLGVADTKLDASKAAKIDGIVPREVGNRFVVGVSREAVRVGKSQEEYFQAIRDAIKKSGISEPLKGSVLSSLNYSNYHQLGLVVMRIPSQNTVSFFEDDVFYREGDSTKKAEQAKKIAEITSRFPAS